MAVKEIKQHWILSCDGCGTETTQAGTHRPGRWVSVDVGQSLCDYHGQPAADGSVKLLFCGDCGPCVTGAINDAADAIRAALKVTP